MDRTKSTDPREFPAQFPGSTLTAYGLVGCFLGMERLARQGQEAKSLEFGPLDRGSTRLLGVAFLVAVLALLVALVLNAFQLQSSARQSSTLSS